MIFTTVPNFRFCWHT